MGPPGRPLRIGLVCPYALGVPGGVQNHVLGLADYLRSRGHHAAVLAPGELPGPGSEDSWFTSAGPAVAVPYNGSVARVSFGPLSSARVRRWLTRGRFDVLHLHEPITPSVALHALRNSTCPVVATFHTATPRSLSMHLAGGVLRPAIDKIDARIAVSDSAREVVRRHLGRDAEVIPNGFRYADFAGVPLERAGRPWRGGVRPRVTFLGRTEEPRKGLSTLLAALPRLYAAVGEVEVVVAGVGARGLPAGVGARGLPTGCRGMGPVDDATRNALLATTDVFVAPHLARESFGVVLIEAMASGAAVVASDLPPFLDLLRAGPGAGPYALGRTFRAGDPAGLAREVAEAIHVPDPVTRHRARRAMSRYDWSTVGREIVDVYASVVAQVAYPRASSAPGPARRELPFMP